MRNSTDSDTQTEQPNKNAATANWWSGATHLEFVGATFLVPSSLVVSNQCNHRHNCLLRRLRSHGDSQPKQ